MTPQFDIDVRRAPGMGYGWRIFRFSDGRMSLVAMGRAPFRWMARMDARHFLRRHRAGVLAGPPRRLLHD
jgi:hypothetical protein